MERWQARRVDSVNREGVRFDAPAYECCSFSVEVKREKERAGDKLRFDYALTFWLLRNHSLLAVVRPRREDGQHVRSAPTVYQTRANRPAEAKHSVFRSSKSTR